MADGVPITAGSGTTILTDDTGAGGHAQVMKLAISTDGSGTLIPADATNGMAVDVTRVIPGTTATALGKAEDGAHVDGDTGVMVLGVRDDTGGTHSVSTAGDYSPFTMDSQGRVWVRPAPAQVRLQVTPTIDSLVYASGDSLCGLMTISNAVRISGGSGIIQSITVLDNTQAQRAAMDILFFDRSVTVAAANAALAMSDADMAFCLGVVSIGPYNTAFAGTPLNSISTLANIGLPIVLNGTDLFAAVCVRGTPTYGGTNLLTFSFTILQD